MSGKRSVRKTVVIVAVCLIAVLAAVLIGGANYLVSFSIGRNTGTADVAPESTLSDEAVQGIIDNWRAQAAQAEAWAGQADVETVQIQSEDGLRLSGEAVVTDASSHLWVIAVHGYRADHRSMAPLASYYGLRGYNALLPDLRGCGESEGDYIGMGWPDRRDMLRWIEWITARDPQAQIVLHGISMGGATVMMTAGEELPAQVKAIVEDCGYTSVWDIFEDEMAYLFHLPAFPLLHAASFFSTLRAGYGFAEASALRQIANAQVPVLFIHGSEDNFVNTRMVYDLYEACRTEKELLMVQGAGHGTSYNHAPDEYFEAVFRFVGRYFVE